MRPQAAPLRLRIQATGGPTQRYWRVVLPLLLVGMSPLLFALLSQFPEAAAFVPFAGVPVVLFLIWSFAMTRMRPVEIMVDHGRLTITGWASTPVEGLFSDITFIPWILPGVGSTHGAAVRIQLAGKGSRALVLGAAGQVLPSGSRGQGSTSSPDGFLTPEDFSALLHALQIPNEPAADLKGSRELRISIVRHTGLGGAFRGMLPWFFTLAFLGVFGGIFGEMLTQQAWGMPVIAGVSLGAIGFGIYRTFLSAAQKKPQYCLILNGGVTLADPSGKNIWLADSAVLQVQQETYVYRTRYGSHRFPVLVLSGAASELRLGVWDTSAALQYASSKEGRAPHFLVGVPDWRLVLDRLRTAR